MKLVEMQLNDIIPYERNPRINAIAVDDVAESIRQCSYLAPIIVDENNVILCGHTRRLALQKLGYKTCNVLIATGLTEQQKRKYRLLDNKVGEKAEWDYELLNWELEDLDFEGYDFGFETLDDSFDEDGLDSEEEKNTVIATVNCGAVDNYERIKDRLQELADEVGGTLSIKMQ